MKQYPGTFLRSGCFLKRLYSSSVFRLKKAFEKKAAIKQKNKGNQANQGYKLACLNFQTCSNSPIVIELFDYNRIVATTDSCIKLGKRKYNLLDT